MGKATVFIANTQRVVEALNPCLNEGHRAYAVGQAKAGARFERIVVLADLRGRQAREWFNHFQLCLAPNGSIVHDQNGQLPWSKTQMDSQQIISNIETLINKAAKAQDATDAMKFAQAALNAAQALPILLAIHDAPQATNAQDSFEEALTAMQAPAYPQAPYHLGRL
jgi:hypothetical protein